VISSQLGCDLGSFCNLEHARTQKHTHTHTHTMRQIPGTQIGKDRMLRRGARRVEVWSGVCGGRVRRCGRSPDLHMCCMCMCACAFWSFLRTGSCVKRSRARAATAAASSGHELSKIICTELCALFTSLARWILRILSLQVVLQAYLVEELSSPLLATFFARECLAAGSAVPISYLVAPRRI
jgi:hypothetical protein